MVHAQDVGADVQSKRPVDSNEPSIESSIEVAADALRPSLTQLPLLEINKIATKYQREGDCVRAVAAYEVLFEKARCVILRL